MAGNDARKKFDSKSGMKKSTTIKDAHLFEELRKKAGEKLKKIEKDLSVVPDEGVRQLIDELHVHQIELEMQNEELRLAHQELEQSRSLYSDLYDFAPVGYLTFDRNGRIMRINLTGAGQLGYERNLLIGKPFSLYMPQRESKAFFSHLRKVFETAEKQSCELKLKRKEGTLFDARLESIVRRNNGEPRCRSAITDITQLKEAEERLRRSNAELEQFAYSASHDMREPLRTIAGFLKLLEKRYKGKLDERADEYIEFTIEGVNRLDILLRDLSEFARLDTKARKFKPVSVSAALEQAIQDLGAAIEESGTEITYDPLPMVMGNESHMVRLFQNLLGNSIKFRKDEKLRIHVSAEQKEDEWVFSVRDNGIGIDPKFFERIFVVFQRLHSREEYEGTGMGLAMCKKIVELHGGRIWVESEPGKGSTFYFSLPLLDITSESLA